MSNRYIFVVSGRDGERTARERLTDSIKDGIWPLNKRTPYQKSLTAGDKIAFYVSGPKDPDAHQVIATAEVLGSPVKSSRVEPGVPTWITGVETAQLLDVPITKAVWLSEPVDVRRLLSSLELVKNTERWGSFFQGGIIRVSDADFAKLVGSID